jgi:ribosomal protein S18 acetylase RimI-like enzyme
VINFRIEKLTRNHQLEGFSCGQPPLDLFLVRYALTNQLANASQTYLGMEVNHVVGYYTLTVGELGYEDAPDRLAKGLARHPIPLMILARLAVDMRYQGMGIGESLVRDAMSRTVAAADIAGMRALAIHAKDDAVRSYYERFGFRSSPLQPLLLYMLVKDVSRSIQEANS